MKKISIIFMFLCILGQGGWAAHQAMSLNVNAHKPSFVVYLPANPTTGYQWSVVDFDKQLLTLTEAHYQRPTNGLIGAGGQMQYLFTRKAGIGSSGTTIILFQYARAWDKTSATQQKVVVHFTNIVPSPQ